MATVAALALTLLPNGRTQVGGSSKNSSSALDGKTGAQGLNSAPTLTLPRLSTGAGHLLNVGQIPNGAAPASSGLKVALAATDLPQWVADVQAKLQATGRFSQVDIIDIGSTTPTLAQLQAYDSVLVWTDGGTADPTMFGNNLADYVDGGGGVVLAVFANASIPLGGRFAGDDYYGIEPANQEVGGPLTLGTVYNPSSPLMTGVSSFNGGTSSYRSNGSPHANSLRVADWSNGEPLLITRIIKGTPRVDLNFYPTSSDQRSDFWQSSTDGATLMANALEFVHPSCAAAPTGMSHWWPGDGDANDVVGHNDGTLQGGATFGTGEVRQGFSFPGNAGDGVGLGLLNLPSTKFGFAAWVNPADTSSAPVLWSDFDGSNGFVVQVFSGFVYAYAFANGALTNYFTTQSNVANNEWHHIAVTFDGTAPSGQRFVIYVDGAASTTSVISDDATSVGSSSSPAEIGTLINGGFPWGGLIDEVQLFDRVLTANEVAGIANTGHAGLCHSCASAPASLLGWWKGDGDATDSQNSFDGVLNGTVPFVTGEVGQAFSFNGDPANHVQVAPNASLDLAQFTVDAWVYPTTSSGTRFIVDKGAHNQGENYLLSLNDGNTVEVDFNNFVPADMGGHGHQFVDSTTVVPTNAWSHIAATFDGTTLALYINGASAGTFTTLDNDPRGPNPVTQGIRIGGRNNDPDPSFPFQGLIDEVEVFDRALPQREVQRIYDAFDGGKCPCVSAPDNMIAWWAGNDSFADIQGNHDGTSNGATFVPGEVNHAFSLNGVDQDVEIPSDPSLEITGSISVDAWIKPDDFSNQPQIVTKYNNNDVAERCWDMEIGPNGHIAWGVQNHSNFRFVDSPDPIPLGVWTHVAGTFNVNTQEVKLYINGVDTNAPLENGSVTIPSVGSGPNTPVIIGAVFNAGNQYHFKGAIDEVELFNRPLTPDEVAGIYHAGGAGKCRPYHTVSVSSGNGGSATGGGTFRQGAPVEVSATPDSCDTFAGWSENNAIVSTANPYDFVVKTGDRSLVATFNKIQYTISVSASPSNGGTVGGGGQKDCGSSVTVTATPKSGFQFVNWTENGQQVSTSANYQFAVNGDRTLVANFKQTSHLGTANGSGTIFTHNNQASFSFNITDNNKKGTPSGTLSYTDTKGGIKLTSTAITSISLNGNQASFSGKGTIPNSKPKGSPIPVSFSVVAVDNGTPGTPKDTFQIQISTPYFASGNLTGGNITVN